MKIQVVDYATLGGDLDVELGKETFAWTRLWPQALEYRTDPSFWSGVVWAMVIVLLKPAKAIGDEWRIAMCPASFCGCFFMQAIATWFINGVTSLRGQINFNNFRLLKFNISNGAEVPSRRYLELQESSKKPAKLTAWRAFCFSKHTAKPSYARHTQHWGQLWRYED